MHRRTEYKAVIVPGDAEELIYLVVKDAPVLLCAAVAANTAADGLVAYPEKSVSMPSAFSAEATSHSAV